MEPTEIIARTHALTEALITARNDRPLVEKLIKDEMHDHTSPLSYMAVLYGALGNMTLSFADAIKHLENELYGPGSFDAHRIEELLNRQTRKKD